ncbi:MAG: stage II sporulation protein R [Anaerostipes sp.]|nr:stage II sporulation protein R [Anaerostipes sp.]
MKRKKWIVFLMFFFILLEILYVGQMAMKKNVEGHVIRFHVKANSDSTVDQNHKLEVRDAIVTLLKNEMKHAENKKEAMIILQKNQKKIQKTAICTLRKLGDSNKVQVEFTRELFPQKDYGSYVFPKGKYDAIRVNIGKAKGHNFWCVMFPELCITKKGKITTEEEARKELRNQVGKLTEWMLRKK